MRYDGTHRRSELILDYFGDRVDWVSVCPEVEVGMGVPRETVELVAASDGFRLLGKQSKVDHTEAMRTWAAKRLDELDGIVGYILKARSPSCGLGDVVVRRAGQPTSGMFTSALVSRYPRLPVVVDEDLVTRESLLEFEARARDYQRT